MATLYERVNKYADSKKKKYLTIDQRCELGRIVIAEYYKIKPPKTAVHTETFTNAFGTFRVISYPNSFSPTIDKLVKEYYLKLPVEPSRERKRIPTSHKPIFSSRNVK